ncbi:MAG: PD-(D/E)XK nuclease family protein, partial [Prevotella sp.]
MNRTFLDEVAADMLHKLGDDLSRTVVIFPNKRARLFFAESLYRHAGHALWSPSYLTISELFRSYSPLVAADEIKLVTELHRSYCICTGSDESLDHFYGWGQVMLTDFDDIDKNLADAGKVLANVADLHEMDDLSYLSEEQVAMLKQFFGTLVLNKTTEMKRRFLQMWKQLYRIYLHYNQVLGQQGLAYEGALYRSVACNPQLSFPFDRYVFVGFNMVHPVEQTMFQRIKDAGKAMFYWDFDHYYMQPMHEAGHYISRLMASFPSELDTHNASVYNCFNTPKSIRLFGASTDNIQARYVSRWLLENNRYAKGKRTAIILCDENMLPSVVHCIPDEVATLNITTGYPLHLSPVVSLVHLLLSLQVSGYDKQKKRFLKSFIQRVRKHPYAKYLDNPEGEVFVPVDEKHLSGWLLHLIKGVARQLPEQKTPFVKEALFRTYTIINRMDQLIGNEEISIDGHTLTRLLTQLLRQTSVPFHGEPAAGVQIMGVLETRNLDFDHMLILSCGEGNIPRGLNDTSFIPYSVRKAYGLTTIDNKTAIYAYYFYRM